MTRRKSKKSAASRRKKPAQRPRPLSRRKTWCFRLLTVALVVLFLMTIEVALRWGGVGRDLQLVVPVDSPPDDFNYQFNTELSHLYYGVSPLAGPEPRRFALPKPQKTYRIVVVGGSTVKGYPYPPELAFPRQMELMLERQTPGVDFEVLNAGITSICSISVRDLVAECLACEPDLIVVHTGHNEFYGPGGASSTAVSVPNSVIPALYAARRCRLTQLCTDWALARKQSDKQLVESLPELTDIPLDSDVVRSAERSYKANLEQMIGTAKSADVPILLTTVESNLKDQSPIGRVSLEDVPPQNLKQWESHFSAGMARLKAKEFAGAVKEFNDAEAAYDGNPLLAYRLGYAQEQLDRHKEARDAYVRARDLDGCRFRAPSSFTKIVKAIAQNRENESVYFFDLNEALADWSAPAAVGYNLYVEHVHYHLEGHYHVARLIAEHLQTEIRGDSWRADRLPEFAEMESELGVIPQDHLVSYSFALQTIATPPLNGAADLGAHRAHLQARIAEIFSALPAVEQQIFADLSMLEMQNDLIGALGRQYAARGMNDRALEMARLGVIRQPWSVKRKTALEVARREMRSSIR